MRRHIHPIAYFVLSLGAFLFPRPGFAEERKPNVILFLADDMGWRDSGAYGSQYYETPNIDRFAKRSMRFTNAYAQPLCSPTRASLLTGQYSARHGITSATGHQPPQPPGHVFRPEKAPANVPMLLPESKNYLEPSQVTLAEVLKSAGYKTAHIGKWHLGLTQPHWPEQQGFDFAWHCHPDPGPPGGYFSPYGVVSTGKPAGKLKVGTITDGADGEYIVDRQAAEAVKFIQDNKDNPFYLNLWCYGVHGPWGHKEEYTKHFAAKQDPSGLQGNPIMASMLRSLDECFGRIVDELERQGIANNTIVIFNSDNGGNTHSNVDHSEDGGKGKKSESDQLKDWNKWAGNQPPTNNAPLNQGKGTLYEGGTRVPLMWSWSGKIPGGSTNESVVGPIDVYPTLLDLVGLKRREEQRFDGVSYAGVLTKNQTLKRTYFNYHPHAGKYRAGGVSVREGDFKLIRWFGNPGGFELFNLREDIGETKDLSVEMPLKVKELDALIDGFLLQTGATYPIANPAYRVPEPKAAASNESASPARQLEAWKERECKAVLSGGTLTVSGSGKSGAAFLGHATGKLSGPAVVRLRVRSESGGDGRIEVYPNGSKDTTEVFKYPFTVTKGDWQEVQVNLDHAGFLGTLRLFLPLDRSPLEIDRIEIKPSRGKGESWEF